MRPLKVIISGGGTGGHIFPALAIAKALKESNPANEILFVGAKGKMEMEKIPQHGFKIIGLDIAGLQRRFDLKNLLLPFKVIGSVLEARNIISNFKPDLAVGVGGYASAPLLFAAQQKNIPTLIQEQNSYAGLANKWLGKKARKVCVAFSGMDKYFPGERVVETGNPVRPELLEVPPSRTEALKFFGLSADKPVILVIGGSLGARTINESIDLGLKSFADAAVQVLWQTGRWYYDKAKTLASDSVSVHQFIQRMDLAYAAADLVISRAGALSIAELCVLGKSVILVPSPNVAEDHQSKNANALVMEDAALLVRDADARTSLVPTALALLKDEQRLKTLAGNIKRLGRPNASKAILEQIYSIVK